MFNILTNKNSKRISNNQAFFVLDCLLEKTKQWKCICVCVCVCVLNKM